MKQVIRATVFWSNSKIAAFIFCLGVTYSLNAQGELDLCLPETVCPPNYVENAVPVNNPIAKEGYDIIFMDDFDILHGDQGDPTFPFDPNNPVHHPFTQDWYRQHRVKQDHERDRYGQHRENIRVEDGKMIITAKKENTQIPYRNDWNDMVDVVFTGGEVLTNPNVGTNWYETKSPETFKYGYFEIKCKLPKGRHLWPSFWFFGGGEEVDVNGNNTIEWNEKTGTEIDMFEMYPTEFGCSDIHSNYHYRDLHQLTDLPAEYQWDPGTSSLQPIDVLDNIGPGGQADFINHDQDFTEAFHTFGLEWTPTQIIWYVDNIPIRVLQDVPSEQDPGTTVNIVEEYYKFRVKLILGMHFKSDDFTFTIFDEEMEMTPEESEYEIEYVRVYRKKPGIVATADNCGKNVMSFRAEYQGNLADHEFKWELSDYSKAAFVGPTNQETVLVSMLPGYDMSSVELILTDIDLDHKNQILSGYENDPSLQQFSTHQITIPGIQPDFEVSEVSCGANGLEVTATADNSIVGATHHWYLYQLVNGVPSGAALYDAIGGTSFTFNSSHGITTPNNFRIVHEVSKKKCVPMLSDFEDFSVDFGAFSLKEPYCDNGDLVLSTAVEDSTVISTWSLYVLDLNGNYLNGGAPLDVQTGATAAFPALQGYEFEIRRSMTTCGETFLSELDKMRMPDYPIQPEFHLDRDIFNVNQQSYLTITTSGLELNPPGHSHHWTLHYSDANHTAGAQLGGVQFTEEATWTVIYDPKKYYMIKHGVFSDCSGWQESRNYLKGDNLYRGNIPNEGTEMSQEGVASTITGLDFIVYPNPSSGFITVELKDGVSTNTNLIIYDASGRIVHQTPIDQRTNKLNVQDLSAGVYTVTMTNTYHTKTNKLLIVKP